MPQLVHRPFIVISTLWFLLSVASAAQEPPPRSNTQHASSMLAWSSMAIARNAPVKSIELSGDVLVGEESKSAGSIRLLATSENRSRVELRTPSLTHLETRDDSSGHHGRWSHNGSNAQDSSFLNCFSPPALFSPALLIQSLLTADHVVSVVDSREENGPGADHLQSFIVVQHASGDSTQSLIKKLSTVDIFLDPATHLPSAVEFVVYSNNPPFAPLHVKVSYGNYREVDGIWSPFHIIQTSDGAAKFDITIREVNLNTNISSQEFQIQ